MRDYLKDFRSFETSFKHHGVRGMKWGVRRSSSQLKAAAKARGDSPKKPPADSKENSSSGGSVKKTGNIQDHVESSADRYDRLTAQAKGGGAAKMTDADLKFYNARTEALAKITKVTQDQPSWLRDTTTKVIQQSAQRQMQGIADNLADKYIGDPLKGAIKGQESITEAVTRGAESQIRDQQIKDGIAEYIKKRST